jgi:hypothetical protein
VRRVDRPDTWQHRPASQHAHATLANGEPSTHGYEPPVEANEGRPQCDRKPAIAGSPLGRLDARYRLAGVTLRGLRVDGTLVDEGANEFPTCAGIPFFTGVFYRNASGSIESTHVGNIRGAESCTFGILAQSGGAGTTS